MNNWTKLQNLLTVISFPAFSGLLPKLIAAAAAAPDEIPTWRQARNIKFNETAYTYNTLHKARDTGLI